MKLEQILKISTLTASQKDRVKACFETSKKLGVPNSFDSLKTQTEVIEVAARIEKDYLKRKEANAKRKANKNVIKFSKDDDASVIEAYHNAIKNGCSMSEVISAIDAIYVNKHNAKIEAQIEALKAQLM